MDKEIDVLELVEEAEKLVDSHSGTMVKYIVGSREFNFSVSEVVLMEYGGQSPFEYDYMPEIFVIARDDHDIDTMQHMIKNINHAAKTGIWQRGGIE